MSEKHPVTVTIDGPSGVGKSTISRKVAAKLGFTYLDTGAMYRAVAWFLKDKGIDSADESSIEAALSDLSIDLVPARKEEDDVGVIVNGKDVSGKLRSPEMSMLASRVSALPCVRSKLTKMQQDLGRKGAIVAEGRDTGTVVFPEADHKFFLEATPEERTVRRAIQLKAKGEEVDEKELLAMTNARDKQDSERAVAPLKKADDATLIDTTHLTIPQVLDIILGDIDR